MGVGIQRSHPHFLRNRGCVSKEGSSKVRDFGSDIFVNYYEIQKKKKEKENAENPQKNARHGAIFLSSTQRSQISEIMHIAKYFVSFMFFKYLYKY